jgi:vancomycin resistance protein YoaR
MKKVLLALGVIAGSGVLALGLMASRFEQKIKPNTFVGPVPVGDLSKDDAAKRLRLWWETERRVERTVIIPGSRGPAIKATPGKLGMTIDDFGSLEALPLDSFWDSAQRTVSSANPERTSVGLKFKPNGQDSKWLAKLVEKSVGTPRPARVSFANGQILREPEISGSTLDAEALPETVAAALESGSQEITVPVKEAPKRIPDDQLNQITDVVAEFSTKFPTRQANRNANLALASGEIDGHILMPGEIFSFNEHLGERKASEGYKVAGVYVNGRHDVAIAGGICQVSGTLYNAAVLANLKIVQRQNHSMPVAYLPVGRDASVSYPSLDLKFQNTMDTPIAISRSFEPGRLTFRILGKKVPGQEVVIQTSGHRSWGTGVKYVHDGSLAPGKSKVIERGSAGHAVNTYRIVKVNGQVVKRELLNSSRYPGGKRIIARNAKAQAAPVGEPEPSNAPAP